MARTAELNITPSLLDRLLDDQPEVSSEPPLSARYTVSQLKRSVARDLEALLNARQEALEDLPPELTEASRSLLMYGLPDFTTLNLLSRPDRHTVQRALERTIAIFEPRLERVQVILEDQPQGDRALGFRVEALLRIEPVPEPVSFDAMLRLQTQEYIVRGQI